MAVLIPDGSLVVYLNIFHFNETATGYTRDLGCHLEADGAICFSLKLKLMISAQVFFQGSGDGTSGKAMAHSLNEMGFNPRMDLAVLEMLSIYSLLSYDNL